MSLISDSVSSFEEATVVMLPACLILCINGFIVTVLLTALSLMCIYVYINDYANSQGNRSQEILIEAILTYFFRRTIRLIGEKLT